MARDSQDSAPMSRFRAFTTSLGFKPSGDMPRSSADQPPAPHRLVNKSSLRSLYGNFTLYLRVHSARNLPAVAQGSYCKLYLGDTPIIGGFGQGKPLVGVDKKQGSSHQTFHTKVQMSARRDCPEWNEKFQLNVRDPNAEMLTIRVKNHVLIYSPAIGACVVQLRQLQLDETIDEWVPLYRNDKPSGEIRLQICLQENGHKPVPERRYSHASEEMIQRLMQEHRKLEDAQRRELELQQQEKWRRMEKDALNHVGLEQHIEREGKWREQCARRLEQQQQQEQERDSDSDLPASFKNRGGKKEKDSESELLPTFKYRDVKKEEYVPMHEMENLRFQGDIEDNKEGGVNFGIPRENTIYDIGSENKTASYPSGRFSCFGTIRLSVDELNQVAQNALPTSESSESTSSEHDRHRRRRKRRDDSKRSRRKNPSKRRAYSEDASSGDSSVSSRGYRKLSSRTKLPQREGPKKGSAYSSVSSRSDESRSQQNPDIRVTLTFPSSPSDEVPSSSSEDKRRRRRRKTVKAKRREKERWRRSKRKHGKSRRNYESSYSSSSLSSSSSSSSLSSSEEERFLRKLEKKKEKKARARAKLAESEGSRASTQSSGMQYPHKLGYAESRNIDSASL